MRPSYSPAWLLVAATWLGVSSFPAPAFVKSQRRGVALGVSINIALTRELGKNKKLKKALQDEEDLAEHDMALIELPCIEHADGPDFVRLSATLTTGSWDYIAVTSPEAARILAKTWDSASPNKAQVVAVGKATEKALRDSKIDVSFCPSKATAETLATELQAKPDSTTTVLYPASAKAKDTLQTMLADRGFAVTRLNTYDTVSASWDEETSEKAKSAHIACFASPSSIHGWLENTGGNKEVLAACIGETSAAACRECGWPESRIFFPERPGLEGWVGSVKDAIVAMKASSVV